LEIEERENAVIGIEYANTLLHHEETALNEQRYTGKF